MQYNKFILKQKCMYMGKRNANIDKYYFYTLLYLFYFTYFSFRICAWSSWSIIMLLFPCTFTSCSWVESCILLLDSLGNNENSEPIFIKYFFYTMVFLFLVLHNIIIYYIVDFLSHQFFYVLLCFLNSFSLVYNFIILLFLFTTLFFLSFYIFFFTFHCIVGTRIPNI